MSVIRYLFVIVRNPPREYRFAVFDTKCTFSISENPPKLTTGGNFIRNIFLIIQLLTDDGTQALNKVYGAQNYEIIWTNERLITLESGIFQFELQYDLIIIHSNFGFCYFRFLDTLLGLGYFINGYCSSIVWRILQPNNNIGIWCIRGHTGDIITPWLRVLFCIHSSIKFLTAPVCVRLSYLINFRVYRKY